MLIIEQTPKLQFPPATYIRSALKELRGPSTNNTNANFYF